MLVLASLLVGGLIGFFISGIIVSSVYKRQIREGAVEIGGELYRTYKASK
ncbi:hypothetical protein TacPo2_21 [Pantoea bacteriophage TacPo2]